jgi:signal peptidase
VSRLVRRLGYTVAILFIACALLLAALSLPGSGWRALSVQTGSMHPAINPGALVLVHSVPVSTLKTGDVITYNSRLINGELVTHRIVAFRQNGASRDIIVKGDANRLPDPPVSPARVVGRVDGSIPGAGRLIDALHKPLGLALIIYIPALLIVIYEVQLMANRLAEVKRADKPEPPLEEPFIPETMPSLRRARMQQRRVARRLDGLLLMLAVGVLLAYTGLNATYAQLTSHAELTGESMSATAPPTTTPTPPSGGGGNSNCSSSTSSTTVNIHTSTSQTSSSGTSTDSSDVTTHGSVSTGSHTNSSSTNVNVNITNC